MTKRAASKIRNEIHPIHFSIRRMLAEGKTFRPRDMTRLKGATREQIDCLHNIAVSIFVDCTNVGVPFQEALVAVYLSGLENGANAIADKDKNDG